MKRNGNVYKTVIGLVSICRRAEWATTSWRTRSKRLEVNEMRMLRWMCAVTRRDNIRNEHIRGQQEWCKRPRKLQKNDTSGTTR